MNVKKVGKALKEAKETKATKDEKDEKSQEEDENRAVLDALAEHTTVDLAPELIDDEVRGMVEDHAQRLQQYGMKLEQWLEQSGKTIEAFVQDLRPQAERNVRVRFGISSLMEEWKIEISEEEMQQRLHAWWPPPPRYTTGAFAKYARLVSGAERGAVTG